MVLFIDSPFVKSLTALEFFFALTVGMGLLAVKSARLAPEHWKWGSVGEVAGSLMTMGVSCLTVFVFGMQIKILCVLIVGVLGV